MEKEKINGLTISFLTAALGMIFSIVVEQSVQPKDRFSAHITIWVLLGIFLLRQLPFFSWLWKHIVIFFMVLIGFVTINYAKREIKSWWNKD